jgi:hypothetical protein
VPRPHQRQRGGGVEGVPTSEGKVSHRLLLSPSLEVGDQDRDEEGERRGSDRGEVRRRGGGEVAASGSGAEAGSRRGLAGRPPGRWGVMRPMRERNLLRWRRLRVCRGRRLGFEEMKMEVDL